MNILKVNTLKLIDPGFPESLRSIGKPPQALYWQGGTPADWVNMPKVAIVGSRKSSVYGQRVTAKLSRELAAAGAVIISGLAYGVDSIAHQAALEAKGLTVAVLGGGLDKIYPVANQALAHQIISSGGCLLSEYPPGTPSMQYQFIARDRIISGLSDVIIIAEAASGSGALHTAQFGLEQGKTVMAIPGPIDQPSYQGCNNLIKTGALPLTTVEDVWLALGVTPKQQSLLQRRFDSPAEAKIYELIKQEVLDQEQLAQAANLSPAQLNHTLTSLELGGHIRPVGAGQWTAS